ncbi:MAG TPA: TRAP transporter substrate-binding protein DctP [Syntrophorhabdaceae bacterium]|nr:TRAP transporter substrate-binding protein DctP [Syntrophorhabdaceae bacterium]
MKNNGGGLPVTIISYGGREIMKRISIFVCVLSAVLLTAFVMPPVVVAQQKVIELTYGTPYGPDHTFSKTDIKWMAKIEKETNGRVKFKPFWGGAIIGARAEAMDEMAKDVADVGFISPGQAKTGYDIAKAMFLFFTGVNPADEQRIFFEVLKKFPEIEAEYKGLKVMCWSSGTQYDLLTRKPVRKLADMKGMRVKTLGEITSVLKDLGVEGVNSPMTEVYVSMQKGILDGGFVTYNTLETLRLSEVAKYYTVLNLVRPSTGSRVMSLVAWNKLPPDIQKVFLNNIEWYSKEADRDVIKDDNSGKEYGKKNGVEYITLPKEESTKFYGLILDEATKEGKNLDAKNIPGSKIFAEIQRLIKGGK